MTPIKEPKTECSLLRDLALFLHFGNGADPVKRSCACEVGRWGAVLNNLFFLDRPAVAAAFV